MENKPEGVVSPFYQPESIPEQARQKLLAHLDLLKMPAPHQHPHGLACSRDCHILERNHTLELVRSYVGQL